MVEKMAYANRDTGNVLGAAETAGMTEYLDHPAINPKQSKHWALDIAVAFPTLHINLSPGGFWSHRFWPISVNSTRWEAEFHVPKPLDRESDGEGKRVFVSVRLEGARIYKKKNIKKNR